MQHLSSQSTGQSATTDLLSGAFACVVHHTNATWLINYPTDPVEVSAAAVSNDAGCDGDLLTLMLVASEFPDHALEELDCVCFLSDCGQYEIHRRKGINDSLSMFIQRADDYLTELDLYINKQLIVTFREPVWPHIHCQENKWIDTPQYLAVPEDCIHALATKSFTRTEMWVESRSVSNSDRTQHHAA